MMGGVHVESVLKSTIGSWLKDSVWEALVEAGITTSGKAVSLLHCSHIKRTRYAHELTVASLYTLLKLFQNKKESIHLMLSALKIKIFLSLCIG